MKTILHISYVLLLVVTALPAFAEKWVREGTGLVFPQDVNNVDIVQVGDSGSTFRAYYMKQGSIYSALSIDDGQTFTDEGVILEGSHPAIVKLDDGRIRIYYTENQDGTFVSAVSSDGRTFTQEDGVRLDASEGRIIHPSIVRLASGTYKLFYDFEVTDTQVGFGEKILSASSADGLTWTRDKGIRINKKTEGAKKIGKVNLVFSPFVQVSGKKLLVYFTAESTTIKKSGLWIAKSNNGKKFKITSKALEIDPAISNPTAGQGGLSGNPQDAFIINTAAGSKRLYVWQAQEGYYSARPK